MENNLVKSVSEFIDVVFRKITEIEKINKLETELRNTVWFRGESSEFYKLIPNIYRIENGGYPYCNDIKSTKIYPVEQNIDASFSRKANIFLTNKGIESTPWNR